MIISYPGILGPIACEYTAGLGIWPGVINLYCTPEGSSVIPDQGTLIMADSYYSLILPGINLKSNIVRPSRRGQIRRLMFLDRRWRWENSPIKGRYNVRKSNGQIISSLQRNAQQLASILFSAMFETTFDVSVLPADDYPEVFWDTDRADLALMDLCRLYGCVPTLDPIADLAGVVRLGYGPPAPVFDAVTIENGLTANPLPASLLVSGLPAKWQGILTLEPIGMDLDGTWKHIDDLSYKPPSGWHRSGPTFKTLSDTPNANGIPSDRTLASSYIYKYYRIAGQTDGGLIPSGYDKTVQSPEQYLPLGDYISANVLGDDFRVSSYPPRLFGRFDTAGDAIKTDKLRYNADVPYEHKVEKDKGVVVFADQVVRTANGLTYPADLYLQCSYGVNSLLNWEPESYSVEFPVNPSGQGGVKWIRHPQLALRVFQNYTISDDSPPSLTGYSSNLSEVQARATALANFWLAGNVPVEAGTGWYAKLMPINLTGRCREISMWLNTNGKGPEAVGTKVSLNSETMPALKSRRRFY